MNKKIPHRDRRKRIYEIVIDVFNMLSRKDEEDYKTGIIVETEGEFFSNTNTKVHLLFLFFNRLLMWSFLLVEIIILLKILSVLDKNIK